MIKLKLKFSELLMDRFLTSLSKFKFFIWLKKSLLKYHSLTTKIALHNTAFID